MKKHFLFILFALVCAFTIVGCRYDDTEVWKKFDTVDSRIEKLELAANTLNSDLAALQAIVNAMKNNVTITEVITEQDGYIIKFSDGTTATISNGKNGINGTNAPEINIKRDDDGKLYWTMDGQFILIDGEKVCAEGIDGKDGEDGTDGEDGITPQIRINPQTKEWEISSDNGRTWVSTSIVAEGKDGKDGKDAVAPQIRINGETKQWEISVDGGKSWKSTEIVAEGKNGKDGIAPQIRINSKSKEWEVSTDGGKSWKSTGIVAEGKNGDDASGLFSTVNTYNPDYVTFVLKSGESFKVARAIDYAPSFYLYNASYLETFQYGQTKSYSAVSSNVAEYSISKPNGWRVSFGSSKLTITAPEAANIYAETEGYVAINLVSSTGKCLIYKISVKVLNETPSGPATPSYTLRTLTFEDSDVKFSPYDMGSVKVKSWSDLIDTPQYNGPLLYGNAKDYYWYDENNTFLMSEFPENWNMWSYAGGGHAISNYCDMDLSHGDFNHQLSVYGTGGHNGSKNFCVQYGYRDNSGWSAENLPYFYFGDGVARVVDHMYVMNTTYAMNCYISGNGLTDKITENDWVKLVAIGYNENGEVAGQVEMYMVNGPNHIVDDWTKWDLSSLGKVIMIEFNVTGSSDNGYGFSQPAYFAYDDVAVRF